MFKRAIIMPNLRPPVTTVAAASAYRDRILASLGAAAAAEKERERERTPSSGASSDAWSLADFVPLMTLYLTDATPPEEIARASKRPQGPAALV